MPPILVWLRQDLRLTDNPALHAAVTEGACILPIYILDETPNNPWPLGGAQRWWLHHSLQALQAQFAKHKTPLLLRRGVPEQILLELIQTTQATTVYWNRCYEPFAIARDKKLKCELQNQSISVKTFNSALLQEPWDVLTDSDSYYKVFTRYWQRCLRQLKPGFPLPKPPLKPSTIKLHSDSLENWELLPKKPDWSRGFNKIWSPGEKGAAKYLAQFIDNKLQDYKEKRDYPNQ